jgi:hypothetical protein
MKKTLFNMKKQPIPKIKYGIYDTIHDGKIRVEKVNEETCRFVYLERNKPAITTTAKHVELMVKYELFKIAE